MIKVLVIANIKQRLQDQIYFCERLKKTCSDFDFLFILDSPEMQNNFEGNDSFKHVSMTNGKSARGVAKPRKDSLRSFYFQAIRETKKKFYHFLFSNSIIEFIKLRYALNELDALHKKCGKVIDDFNPDIIIANGDRHFGMEQAVLKIAKAKSIKVIVPYMIFSCEAGPLKTREDNPLYKYSPASPFITKKVVKRYPDQVISSNGSNYLFYPPSKTIALNKFGTLSSYPWYVGNGLSDVVCVDSEHSLSRYLDNKVPKEKLRLVGDMSYDTLHDAYSHKEEIKKRLIEQYGLASDKKIAMLSLPQLGEGNVVSWDRHWQEVFFLIETLRAFDVTILISLHPKMHYENYTFLEKKYNCRILKERLYEVLPIADLFVATFSSTVIWAILCGINSIVVDFYGYNYTVFNFLETVPIVSEKETLHKHISEFLDSKPDYSNDWKRLSRDKVFDGKTIERYKDLLISTAKK